MKFSASEMPAGAGAFHCTLDGIGVRAKRLECLSIWVKLPVTPLTETPITRAMQDCRLGARDGGHLMGHCTSHLLADAKASWVGLQAMPR